MATYSLVRQQEEGTFNWGRRLHEGSSLPSWQCASDFTQLQAYELSLGEECLKQAGCWFRKLTGILTSQFVAVLISVLLRSLYFFWLFLFPSLVSLVFTWSSHDFHLALLSDKELTADFPPWFIYLSCSGQKWWWGLGYGWELTTLLLGF